MNKKYLEIRLQAENKIVRDLIRKSNSDPLRRQNRLKKRPKHAKIWVAGIGLIEIKDKAF